MRKIIIALPLLLIATPGFAALSGFYDSAEKIDAILKNPDVADAVRQAPIGAISNTGTDKDGADLWQVRVQECDLTVRVIMLPQDEDVVGMATYKTELKGKCQ